MDSEQIICGKDCLTCHITTCRHRVGVSGDVTGRHLDGVSQPGLQGQMLSLEKWELRGLTHEQQETRERREDRLIGQPVKLEVLNS